MTAPVQVPRAAFAACVYVVEGLETDAARASLISGLFGYFLSGFPADGADIWHKAISRLALEGAAVGRRIDDKPGAR